MNMKCEWIEKSLVCSKIAFCYYYDYDLDLFGCRLRYNTSPIHPVDLKSLVGKTCFVRLRKPDTILLTGLIGSGKTVLFYQISKVMPVNVVDLHGDTRLQSTTLGFLRKAAGIVFVVDATEILWNCHSVSKYLYDILTNTIVVKRKIPLLILCNKSDKLNAHSKEFIARQLEKGKSKHYARQERSFRSLIPTLK